MSKLPKTFSECLEPDPNAESIKKWAIFFQNFGRVVLVLALIGGLYLAHAVRAWYICVGTAVMCLAIFVSYKFMYSMLVAMSDLVESTNTVQKTLLYKVEWENRHRRHKSMANESGNISQSEQTEINIIAPDIEVCPYCKETQIAGRRFCVHCGATLR